MRNLKLCALHWENKLLIKFSALVRYPWVLEKSLRNYKVLTWVTGGTVFSDECTEPTWEVQNPTQTTILSPVKGRSHTFWDFLGKTDGNSDSPLRVNYG